MGQVHYPDQQCTQNISINTGFQLIINNTTPCNPWLHHRTLCKAPPHHHEREDTTQCTMGQRDIYFRSLNEQFCGGLKRLKTIISPTYSKLRLHEPSRKLENDSSEHAESVCLVSHSALSPLDNGSHFIISTVRSAETLSHQQSGRWIERRLPGPGLELVPARMMNCWLNIDKNYSNWSFLYLMNYISNGPISNRF